MALILREIRAGHAGSEIALFFTLIIFKYPRNSLYTHPYQ